MGAASQTVTVQANALQVQAETSEVSSLISGEQITQLATNGRNMVSLATLGLGVSANLPDSNMPTSVGSSFSMSFNGARPDHNVWMIDGGEDYDRGSGGKASVMPSPMRWPSFRPWTATTVPTTALDQAEPSRWR